MRILIFLLFLLPLSLIGQVESQFNGTLNVFSASRIGFTNTFTISGIFSNTMSHYTSANSAVGDIVQVQSGTRFYHMHIYSIASNSGGVITCNVRDSSSTLTTFPTGKWSIFRPTPNLRLPLSPDGETNASRSATLNALVLKVDDIQQQVSSSTNCERTITKTAHGFRKWTPVYWTGSNYVRPPYDSLVPDYIVVDSLTANTFKVASCGTYPTVLPDGLYWFTSESPGYSLTPDTTKAPLFQVIDSVLIFNPIVGFNLMAGSGSVDKNGIYSGSDSLSQTNTYVAMASDGSQNFGLGYWPSFPLRDYDYTSEHGLFDNLNYGEVTLANKSSYLSLYSNNIYLARYRDGNSIIGELNVSQNNAITGVVGKLNDESVYFKLDTLGFEVGDNIGVNNSYRFPLPSVSKPSTTSGRKQLLQWTAGLPSFSDRYVSDTLWSNVHLKMDAAESYDFAIGRFQDFPDASISSGKRMYGLLVSPKDSRWGTVALYNYNTNRQGGQVEIYQGTNGGSLLTYFDFNSSTSKRSQIKVDSSKASLLFGNSGGSVSQELYIKYSGLFYRYNNSAEYQILPYKTSPSATSGAISNLTWTAGTPSFVRSQHKVVSGTTDGSGDLTITFDAAMPDATYSLIAMVEGTTTYQTTVHTKGTGSCKIRFFNSSGTPVTSTSVTISYEAKDYQ